MLNIKEILFLNILCLSLIGCGGDTKPYPHLSSIPERPIVRLTPKEQDNLKDSLQQDWHKAEEKHAQNP